MSFLVRLSVLYQSEKSHVKCEKNSHFSANGVSKYTHIQKYKFQFLIMLNIINGCLKFKQMSHLMNNTKNTQKYQHIHDH